MSSRHASVRMSRRGEAMRAAAPLELRGEALRGTRARPPRTAFVDAWIERRTGVCAFALFVVLVAVYHADDALVEEGDAVANIELPFALLETGALDFSPDHSPIMFFWKSAPPLPERDDFYVRSWHERHEGRAAGIWYATGKLRLNGTRYFAVHSDRQDTYVSTFSVVPGLTFLPMAAVLRAMGPEAMRKTALRLSAARLHAASLTALSAVFLFLIARRYTRPTTALWLAAAYALGTCAWSIASQTLWQQTVNLALLTAGAYAFLRALEHRLDGKAMFVAGMLFGTATASRPTAVFYLAALAYYLLRERRTALPGLAAGAAVPLSLIALYNLYYFGTPFNFAQELIGHQIALEKTGDQNVWQTPLIVGAAGLLASPSRGLLVFSPFLALSAVGMIRLFREQEYASLRPLAAAALLTMAVQCKWFDWWGGWTYGYRPWLEAVPVLVLALLPVAAPVLARPWAAGLVFTALAWSVFVQGLGAFAYDKYWNARDLHAVVRRSGERQFYATENEARGAAQRNGGAYEGLFKCNIDLPVCRYRLWSLEDNIVSFYLERWPVAREHRMQLSFHELAGAR
jgi:hypothetical protein